MFLRQKDLVDALRPAGHELVLDTNVAELSVIENLQQTDAVSPGAEAFPPAMPLRAAQKSSRR